MSNKVALVTDSTAYLPPEYLHQYNITVAPLSVIWGTDIYRDGVDLQPEEFYRRLATSKTMPTTSQVTPGTLHGIFEALLAQDYDVLGIFLSSKISGTVQSALQARDMFPNAKDHIAIIDSLWTTMAMGLPILMAARAAQAGESLAACEQLTHHACQHTGVLFVVETLEFLHRGGRIGGAQALLGSALNLKPILEMRAGKIEAVERIRSKQKAMQRVVEIVADRIKGRDAIRLAVTQANSEADAARLLESARGELNPVETFSGPLSPVIGAHAGPGTVALNYMSDVS